MQKEAEVRACAQCGKRRVKAPETICRCCYYANRVEWMRSLDPDDQDWEFATCEECGSSLDSCGDCRNTWCGASPYQGTDWY